MYVQNIRSGSKKKDVKENSYNEIKKDKWNDKKWNSWNGLEFKFPSKRRCKLRKLQNSVGD